MVYFAFLVKLVWKEISAEKGQIWPFMLQPETLTPRQRLLCLGEPDTEFSEFSGPPRLSNAPPKRTSPLRRSEALPKRTYKLCFCSSLLISLTIVQKETDYLLRT